MGEGSCTDCECLHITDREDTHTPKQLTNQFAVNGAVLGHVLGHQHLRVQVSEGLALAAAFLLGLLLLLLDLFFGHRGFCATVQ